MKYSTCIGIDTHARKNAVCALDARTGELREATLSSDPAELVRWIEGQGFAEPAMCVYEAGPTGFGLARALRAAGVGCVVAATSKLAYPRDKDKRDDKDAEWLARQLLAGAVRAVCVPSERQESLCRLSRLRAEAALDLRRAKQRLRSFMLVAGIGYTATKKLWTKKFMAWAQSHECGHPADTFAFREKYAEVVRMSERLARVEAEIARAVGEDPALSEKVSRLLCIHGIGRVTAFSLVCEVYDFSRFRKGSSFACYLGLVSSEATTGEHRSLGGITKLGNSNLRRLMIEAAGCYGREAAAAPPAPEGVPAAVAAKALKCRSRLLERRRRLRDRGLAPNKAKVAIARELAEWVYYIMVMPA